MFPLIILQNYCLYNETPNIVSLFKIAQEDFKDDLGGNSNKFLFLYPHK